MAILPERLSDVSASHLDQLCASAAPESQTLEFKRELPDRSDRGKAELLKDVCAFANADGGDVIYGIDETSACASTPVPIAGEPADAAKRRLSQTLDASLEPRVPGLQIHEVPIRSGYVLIVRVPASYHGPHRYLHNGHWRFVIRNGTHVSELTYPQIRAAFDRTATLSQQAREFRAERLAVIASGRAWRPLVPGPLCVVHLVPIAAMSGRISADVQRLFNDGFEKFRSDDWGGASRTLNLDGLVVYPGARGKDPSSTYMQVFRNGAFEAVRTAAASFSDHPVIWAAMISDYARSVLWKLIQSTASSGTTGPALVSLSLLKVSGQGFALPSGFSPQVRGPADRPEIVIPDHWIERIEAVSDIDEIARPLLDILWQSFGVESCKLYDTSGKWSERLARG